METGGGKGYRCPEKRVNTPVGLGDRAGFLPLEMPGGGQQRVAIARVFVNTPALLPADTLCANPDSRYPVLIWKLNRRFRQTAVIVSEEERTG